MAITCTPASPRALIDACHVAVTAAADNRAPNGTGGPFEYKMTATSPAWTGKPLVSHLFNTSHALEHRPFDGLIFPIAGTWTLRLIDTSDDSIDQTQAVTVT